MLRYGIIGYGYWGPNLTRAFHQAKGSTLVAVADQQARNLERALQLYPKIKVFEDALAMINDPDIDIIAVATPVSTHYELAKAALEAGKHVVVEKPLCGTVEEAERLVELAAKKNLQILIDHTFVYTAAVRRMAQMSKAGDLGRVLYYDSTRINLGLFQSDVNVIWDLVVHDFAIVRQIMPDAPIAISAAAVDPMGSTQASLAYVTLYYPGNTVAHIHASWLAPVKIRQIIVGGDKSMIVYDDMNPSEKIRIYDKGVEIIHDTERERALKVEYRIGDMYAPNLDNREALSVMAEHANECFAANKVPITSGEVGLGIVRLLEMADSSVRQGGIILKL